MAQAVKVSLLRIGAFFVEVNMVKISDSPLKGTTNYVHLVGDQGLAQLLSQIQSAVIKTGNELEKHINDLIPGDSVTDLSSLYRANPDKTTEVIVKPHKPKSGNKDGIIVDYAVISHSRLKVTLVELKSSSRFDTQKAPQIYRQLNEMGQYINHPGLGYQVDIAVCVFHSSDPLAIYEDLKRVGFKPGEVITGIQFCNLVGISFEAVMSKIAEDQPENKNYILMAAERIRQGLPITPEDYLAQKEKVRSEQLRLHWYGGCDGEL
jgi:hypothetical protein